MQTVVKKSVKSLSILFALIFTLSCFGMSAFAASNGNDPYEAVFNSINEEYDLDLGYVTVNPENISLEDYKQTTRELAIQQRQLLDNETNEKTTALFGETVKPLISPRGIVSVTKTKDAHDQSNLRISVTYDLNESGNLIFNARNADVGAKPFFNIATAVRSGPTYTYLDGSRTLRVKFYIDMEYLNSGAKYKNVMVYAEFAGK